MMSWCGSWARTFQVFEHFVRAAFPSQHCVIFPCVILRCRHSARIKTLPAAMPADSARKESKSCGHPGTRWDILILCCRSPVSRMVWNADSFVSGKKDPSLTSREVPAIIDAFSPCKHASDGI